MDSDGPLDAKEADRKVSTGLRKRFQLQFCRFFGSVATFLFRISGLPKSRLDMSKISSALAFERRVPLYEQFHPIRGGSFFRRTFCTPLHTLADRLSRFTQRLRLQQNARTRTQIYKMRGRRCSRRMAHSDIVGEGGNSLCSLIPM